MAERLLSTEERLRFAAYCQNEAKSYRLMSEQMKRLPATQMLAEKQTQYASAYATVARHLLSVEEQTI